MAFCSEETGEAKSEIFRKALKSYYENVKFFKNVLKRKEEQAESQEDDSTGYSEYEEYSDEDYEGYGVDGISLKRAIECPYCKSENNMDFADDCETSCEERQMGPQSICLIWKTVSVTNVENDLKFMAAFGSIL